MRKWLRVWLGVDYQEACVSQLQKEVASLECEYELADQRINSLDVKFHESQAPVVVKPASYAAPKLRRWAEIRQALETPQERDSA